jgi:excinuclease ABC subunit B
LIQTAGRAARHLNGEVVLFADRMTKSILALIRETDRRRAIQEKYNQEHNLVPRSVIRGVQESLQTIVRTARGIHAQVGGGEATADAQEVLKQLEEEMWEASEKLEYERAALLRDQIDDWKKAHHLGGVSVEASRSLVKTGKRKPVVYGKARPKPKVKVI